MINFQLKKKVFSENHFLSHPFNKKKIISLNPSVKKKKTLFYFNQVGYAYEEIHNVIPLPRQR